MKGFLIGAAILTALAIGILTQYVTLGEKILASTEAEEGLPAAIKEGSLRDAKAFAAKFQPFIEKRWKLAWAGNLLNADEFSEKVTRSTMERYLDTALERDPALAKQLFLLCSIREKTLPPLEAFHLYKKYIELFPEGEKVAMARNAVNNMAIKYGMQ